MEGRSSGPCLLLCGRGGPGGRGDRGAEGRKLGEHQPAAGRGRQVPHAAPPRPAPTAGRNRKQPGQASLGEAPGLGEARDPVRPRVGLTGCQPGSPPPQPARFPSRRRAEGHPLSRPRPQPPIGPLAPAVPPRLRLGLSLVLVPPTPSHWLRGGPAHPSSHWPGPSWEPSPAGRSARGSCGRLQPPAPFVLPRPGPAPRFCSAPRVFRLPVSLPALRSGSRSPEPAAPALPCSAGPWGSASSAAHSLLPAPFLYFASLRISLSSLDSEAAEAVSGLPLGVQ